MKIVKQDERERSGRKAGRAWQTTKGASSLLLVTSIDLRKSSAHSLILLLSPADAADCRKSLNKSSVSSASIVFLYLADKQTSLRTHTAFLPNCPKLLLKIASSLMGIRNRFWTLLLAFL